LPYLGLSDFSHLQTADLVKKDKLPVNDVFCLSSENFEFKEGKNKK